MSVKRVVKLRPRGAGLSPAGLVAHLKEPLSEVIERVYAEAMRLSPLPRQDPETLRRELFEFRWRLLVEMRGGKCERCGAIKDSRLMDFHHVAYPAGYDKQRSTISYKIRRYGEDAFWDEVISEVRDHCILLCLSCHMKEHKTGKKRNKSHMGG